VAKSARTAIRSPEWDIQAAPTEQGQGGFGPQLSLSCNSSRKRHCRQLEDESIDRRDIGSAES